MQIMDSERSNTASTSLHRFLYVGQWIHLKMKGKIIIRPKLVNLMSIKNVTERFPRRRRLRKCRLRETLCFLLKISPHLADVLLVYYYSLVLLLKRIIVIIKRLKL